jgi:HD superfamily phosphohydrolase
MRRDELVYELEAGCPTIKVAIDSLAEKWLAVVQARLNNGEVRGGFPKVFNDPVWGTIEFLPWEVVLLDSPLVQRLRGVRQLGLAHYVYPGAGHDRLEHARGVVEAAERMLRRLERNAKHRSHYGVRPDQAIPALSEADHYIVRLAALLHDLGHGPFSHAIEPLIEQRYAAEFRKLSAILRDAFEGAGAVSVSEAIAVLLVLSTAMDGVLNHNDFAFPATKTDLAMRLVARIIGARSHLAASYLSGVVSGPVDADKLDYMARDGHHAGLSVGLDTDRLLSKLEVITITPENVPPRLDELRRRAEESSQRRIYDMGISISGIGAYEQMIVGRVVLYDRLYYHHKVRAADAMAQRLIQVAEEERGTTFTIPELFLDVSDDTMIEVLGGRLATGELRGGGQRARDLAAAIRERRLYHRALAFASRFVAGLEGFQDEGIRDSERAALWRQVTRELDTFEAIGKFEREIYDTALAVANVDERLKSLASRLRPEHVIVDLPANKARAGGNLLLTRTENDEVGLPNAACFCIFGRSLATAASANSLSKRCRACAWMMASCGTIFSTPCSLSLPSMNAISSGEVIALSSTRSSLRKAISAAVAPCRRNVIMRFGQPETATGSDCKSIASTSTRRSPISISLIRLAKR